MFTPARSFTSRILSSSVLATVFVAALSTQAFAEPPLATGSIRNVNRTAWGVVEVRQGGKLGVWLRIIYNGRQSVMTVMPDAVTADGRITGKFINYDLPGFSGEGDPAEFKNWVEDGGGDFTTDPFMPTATEITGQMAYTYSGTQNMTRIPIVNPKFEGFILTSP